MCFEYEHNITDSSGQSTLQLILPLMILLSILITFAVLLPTLSTTKTIALLFGLIIFILSFLSTEIALYILIFTMLLSPEFIVGATQGATLGRGITIRLDDLILPIIGFSWLAKMSINKDLGLFLRTPLNKPIAFYIITCLVSTLFGSLFGRVNLKTGFFFVLKYFEYMIVYFMVVNHIHSKKQINNYLWALLLTCLIVSFIGIAQIPLGGRVTAPFEGESGEPNTFGGYLVFMISIVMGLLLTSRSIKKSLIYIFLIVIFAIPLLYTQSRSSYIAVIPIMITFLVFSEKRKWLFFVFVILAIAIPFMVPDVVQERLSYTVQQGRERTDVVEIGGVKLDTSTSARLLSWKAASTDWVKHPILGYGITGYRFVDAQYIRVIVETGLLGLITFFLLMITTFRKAKSVFHESSEPFDKGLAMGFLAGLIGLLFHGLSSNTFIIVRIMEPFWFVAAMVILTSELKQEET